MTTAEKLRKIRGDLTQDEFAVVLGVDHSTISQYESGLRTPRDEIKKRYAEYAGLTVDAIFFSDGVAI